MWWSRPRHSSFKRNQMATSKWTRFGASEGTTIGMKARHLLSHPHLSPRTPTTRRVAGWKGSKTAISVPQSVSQINVAWPCSIKADRCWSLTRTSCKLFYTSSTRSTEVVFSHRRRCHSSTISRLKRWKTKCKHWSPRSKERIGSSNRLQTKN